ncbi:Hint domain-containing protein [Roseovarius salis]|uniref:Hint domain-containing protein n=1 Tax=Roseovarius salis TaxID=3376063 RepID=UPI0037C94ACF
MSWIGATARTGGWFDAPGRDRLMPRGTLMLETRIPLETRPRVLLGYERTEPWHGAITLQVLPDGGIVLLLAQGADTHSAVVPCPDTDRSETIRVSFCWDAPRRRARLTVERADPGHPRSVNLTGIQPMVTADMHDIMARPERRRMDSDVTFAAVSDRMEPVGPLPGLTAQTPVMTAWGERPVCRLRRGDLIITDQGQQVPVLQVIRHTLPARGGFHPVRLRAGYFGLTRDIVVAPFQRLVMRGSDVEYMFGREAVLVPARNLLDNIAAVPAKGPEMVTYFQLLLPGHETVMTSGCPVESLFVGRLRRKPDELAASVLARFDRSRLPEHPHPAWPVLKPFEAVALAADRAA